MSMTPVLNLFHPDEVQLAPDNDETVPSYLKDHRKRLRRRFVEGGADAIPDYELLELVLFRAIPRQDVKPLANRLLSVFGTLNNVIAAPDYRLLEVKGVGESVVLELKILEAVVHRHARNDIIELPLISSWDAVVKYCRAKLANLQTEQCRVLFLDRKNRLIADEVQGQGTIDQVQVYPREIVKRCLELGAAALILIHNHPSGDPSPSDDDIFVTKAIEGAAATMEIILHDHIIIGGSKELSLRAAGYI